jgi:hypothetical protein
VSAWRDDCLGWTDGDAGHTYRLRHVERPFCSERRWPGSHVACVCLPDHDGPHESADGDQWEDEP